MKNLWIGTTAGLNRKWAELRASQPGVWVTRSFSARTSRKKPEYIIESNLQYYCLQLLREAFGDIGDLFEGNKIDAIIRTALRDDRCAGLPEFQNLLARPGMVRVLSDKLKRTVAPEYADDESLPWFADQSLQRLRSVYNEKLALARGLDTPGLFLQFITKSQTPELQQAMQKWHVQLKKKFPDGYNFVIPRADQFIDPTEKLELSAISILLDGFEKADLGANLYPDDHKLFEKFTSPWTTLGLQTHVIPLLEDAPESHFLKDFTTCTCPPGNFSFIKATAPRHEIQLAVDYVKQLLEGGYSLDSVTIHTPQQGHFLDQLCDELGTAGIPFSASAPPLIEEPLVRTILDIAQAIIHDWPVEALADLLRHPDFRGNSIAQAESANHLKRMARDVERLGNVNGLETIAKLLPVRHEATQRQRGQAPETAYTIYAGSLLRNLANVARPPASDCNWAENVVCFKHIIQEIFGPMVMDQPAVQAFWQSLENSIGAALPGDTSAWSWADFHREAHLRAEQVNFSAAENTEPDNAPKIALSKGTETVPATDHLVLVGMTEGHFPSRSRIRTRLKKLQSADWDELKLLQSEELRIFRQLVGSAGETIWAGYHTRDVRGVDLEPSDFLQREAWQPAPPLAPQDAPQTIQSEHLRHLLNVQKARLQGESGPFTGEITQPHVREMLRRKFNADYIFSPTSLESASLCPFQFFSTYVLGLADEEEENDLETDFIAEGTAIHAILDELHQLEEQPQLLTADIPEFLNKIKELIRIKHPCPPDLAESALGRARWQVEHRRIEQRLAAYHEQSEADLAPPPKYSKGNGKINAHTEFQGDLTVIGREVRAGGRGHRLEPLKLTEDQTGLGFRIGGRIDRIDGQSTGPVARVRLLDYKTGNPINEKQVRRKLHLQLPIYAMMVHERQLDGHLMEVVDIGFWYLKRSKGGYKSIRLWLSEAETLDHRSLADDYRPHLQMLVGRVRNGFFPVRPQEFGCERQCPYGEVCRIRAIRPRPARGRGGSQHVLINN